METKDGVGGRQPNVSANMEAGFEGRQITVIEKLEDGVEGRQARRDRDNTRILGRMEEDQKKPVERACARQ